MRWLRPLLLTLVWVATCAPALAGYAATGPAVKVWVTTGDQRLLLAPQADGSFASDANNGGATYTIDVDETQQFQEVAGFGAALTDSSAWLLSRRLTATARTTAMAKLFDPVAGIGLSYLRLPMGATDFALSDYTYHDLPAGVVDPTLTRFSIQHDRAYILPVLKQAMGLNPKLRVMASPWSAPAWMKTSNSLFYGSLRRDAYPAYAAYLTKFLQAYKQEGVPIDTLTLQNEPHFESWSYPSMRVSAADAAALVKDHVGPALANSGTGTKLLIWDHNWDEPQYPIAVLNDPGANRYVAGSGFHCYAGGVAAQSQVRQAHPTKDIYLTECSGGGWMTDFGTNMRWTASNLIIGGMRHWAKTVLLWNLALDTRSGPQNGGCTNCRGVVTVRSFSSVAYNVEYYVLGHASKFVVPGARRIGSTSFNPGRVESVAFRNPDGSKVLIVLNGAWGGSEQVKIRWAGQSFKYTLPAGTLATFTWAAA